MNEAYANPESQGVSPSSRMTESDGAPGGARKACPGLLDTIRMARATVGDGLTDDEFTRLLAASELPCEAGFTFLNYSEGCVLLKVPPQDLAAWYPEHGWILPAKERVARAIAEKYRLSLFEPPDMVTSFLHSDASASRSHHHFAFIDGSETLIVAHPRYLKIRLFGLRNGWRPPSPLLLSPGLLPDLSALYIA